MAGIDGGRIVIASIREWVERKATTTPWSMFCGVHTVICVVGRLLLGLEEEGGRLVKDWMERASDGSMIVNFFVGMYFSVVSAQVVMVGCVYC